MTSEIKKKNLGSNSLIGLTLEDLRIVLDGIHIPILIAEIKELNVIFANDSFLELVQYSFLDVLNSKLNDLLIDTDLSDVSDGISHVGNLYRRNNQPIPVKFTFRYFGKKQKSLLVSIDSVIEEKSFQHDITEQLLVKQNEILPKLENLSIDELLSLILELAVQIFSTDFINLYLQKGGNKKTLGIIKDSHVFPKEIPAVEASRIQRIDFWEPGKRVLSEIHRAARTNNILSIFTFPIGINENSSGLFIIAYKESINTKKIKNILEKFSDWLDNIIEVHSLIHDLSFSVNKSLTLLDKQRIILNQSSIAYVVVDCDNKIIEYNDEFLELIKYSPIEIHNQGLDILFKDSVIVEKINNINENVLKNASDVEQIYDRSGTGIPVEIKVEVNENLNVSQKIIVLRDLSIIIENQKKISDLENRAALGEVIADFAHEVRNPINNLTTGLQLLSIKLPNDGSLNEVVSRMQEDCLRMNFLMESVLAFSRQKFTNFKGVDLDSLINRIINKLGNTSNLNEITLTYKKNPNLKDAMVLGDQRSLEQIFINLITNAIEAITSLPGSVSVNISDSLENPDHLHIKIADTGPGIPLEIKEKIFLPFISEKQSGTGLGLAIVKKIIDAHSGWIDIETFSGGTIFNIFIPKWQTGDQR